MKELDVLKSEEAVLSARRHPLDRTPFGGKIEGWRGGSGPWWWQKVYNWYRSRASSRTLIIPP
jgi:hypothetical protein